MRKRNIITAIISNVTIIVLIAILFSVCIPYNSSSAVSAPVYRGDENKNAVSVMINVYEGSEYVEQILTILEEYNATCTFFVGGIWAEKNARLLNKMAEHAEIGNHGYLHMDHATLSTQRNKEEIMLCHNLVKQLTGIDMKLFAPPSGSIGDNMLKVCEEYSYTVVMWSKDTIDWRDKDCDLITKRATSGVQSGDLILMHPTENTVKALPGILKYYKEKNLSVITVGELLGK